MAVIEVEGLTRRYRSRTGTFRRRTAIVDAIKGVSFAVERGDLFRVPPRERRARIDLLLEMVELKGRERERVETYSRGMKQRLHIARGLLHDPEILFLDEPTIGLDPLGARELRETIAGLHESGKTILLTTHYMYEADALCQRIAVIANGSFVATGTPSDLKAVVGDHTIVEIETFGVPDETVERLRRLPGVRGVGVETRDQAQVLLVQSAVGADVVRALLNELSGADTGKVITREPTLEDAYVELVRSA